MALVDDLAALKAARASGEKRVTYGSPPKTVEYRDMDDLLKAIGAVESEMAAAESPPATRSSVAYFNRGYR